MKLFKIASEINIGKDAIVEFLQGKGFSIENRPTAELTESMLDAIYDKFKKEKKAVEKQREKIQKQKQFRKGPEPKGQRTDQPFTEHAAEGAISDSLLEESTATVAEINPNIVSQEQSSNDNDFKVGTVIDLHSGKLIPKVSKPAPQATANQSRNENQFNNSANSANDNRSDTQRNEQFNKKKDKFRPKSEDEKAVIEGVKLFENIETTVEVVDVNKFKDLTVGDSDEDLPLIKSTGIADDDDTVLPLPVPVKKEEIKTNKKRKKRKKIAEVEFEVGESPKLKGLTIVGKIDLKQQDSVGKPKDKKKVKKVIEEDEESLKIKLAKPTKPSKKNKKGKVMPGAPQPGQQRVNDKKKKKRVSVRESITTEDIDKAIKQTLSDMGETSSMSNRSKIRLRKRAEREEKEQKRIEEEAKDANVLHLTEFVTTADLAKMLGISPNEIILKCMGLGLMVSINQRLDKDTITIIADDYGLEVEFFDDKAIQAIDEYEEDDEDLMPRSPIVTIMGHVDHGKTSLLDYIRNSTIVAGEAGGITQHIGAYRVELTNKKSITFLDTPGHEAFTAMRARGAQVTDIVILVVSADDSVMPQTIEAISHSLAANVPIVVAINKIDKPDSQPDRIRQQLSDHGILVEEWGGKYQCVEISAKKGLNIDILLDKILLEAEMLELKANPDRLARATVIEANMTKGMGPVCTVIVQKGTLNIGDAFAVGHQFGRVRALFDERSNKLDNVGPSMPARVVGLNGLPEAGDILTVVDNDVEARSIAIERQQLRRQQDHKNVKHVTLDDISKKILDGDVKDLYLIIKADVGGSVEALSDSLHKLSTDEVRVNIIHKGVGAITESDVMLAVASGAIIIGFQVSPSGAARKIAENEAVDIRLYSIIYDCIDEVKRALEGLLTPELKEDIIAVIEVRKVFKISKYGTIAGCYVQNGKITRNDKVRIVRTGVPIFNGYIDSLKRNKDDVREVDSGYECGISLQGFNDIEVGDSIEAYKVLEIKRTLA